MTRSVLTRSAQEWSLDRAIREGRRAIYSKLPARTSPTHVTVHVDALRVLVANTEVVERALLELVDKS